MHLVGFHYDARSSECQIEVGSCVRPSAHPLAFFHSNYSRCFDDKPYGVPRANILCRSSLDPEEEPLLSHSVKFLYSNAVHAPLVLQVQVSAPVCPSGLRRKRITGDITENCHILLQGVCCS